MGSGVLYTRETLPPSLRGRVESVDFRVLDRPSVLDLGRKGKGIEEKVVYVSAVPDPDPARWPSSPGGPVGKTGDPASHTGPRYTNPKLVDPRTSREV